MKTSMNSYWFKYILIFIILFIQVGILAQSISPKEFASRREHLLSLLGTNNAAVLKAANTKVRSLDVNYRYRQESNLFYLTGKRSHDIILLLIPGGINIEGKLVKVLLFEHSVTKDSVINSSSNIEEAFVNRNKFDKIFNTLLKNIDTLFISSPGLGFVNDWINNKPMFIERDSYRELQKKFPNLRVKYVSPIISRLREIKSPNEIEVIKHAISITGKGIKDAIGVCKPGKWEYELRAAIEYEMLRSGCDYPAFPSIIGSGLNSLKIHYDDDNIQMEKGNVVVMDVGAEYEGYSADITRTIPVAGRFTEGQEKIYNLVLKAQNEIIKIIKPGIKFADLDNKAIEVFKAEGLDKYLIHSVSHSLGLDTHDVTSDQELKSGMVITVEPGLYIPKNAPGLDSEYCGFGIRIEDDVLITENSCIVLSAKIPKDIKTIENMMKD